MIKTYDDLTDTEQNKLSFAWLDILKGLEIYEELTGAELADVIASEIWESVDFQKGEA